MRLARSRSSVARGALRNCKDRRAGGRIRCRWLDEREGHAPPDSVAAFALGPRGRTRHETFRARSPPATPPRCRAPACERASGSHFSPPSSHWWPRSEDAARCRRRSIRSIPARSSTGTPRAGQRPPDPSAGFSVGRWRFGLGPRPVAHQPRRHQEYRNASGKQERQVPSRIQGHAPRRLRAEHSHLRLSGGRGTFPDA